MNQPWIYMYSPSRFPLPHSSILAWRIPWTAELGRVQSMELQKSDSTEVTKAATISQSEKFAFAYAFVFLLELRRFVFLVGGYFSVNHFYEVLRPLSLFRFLLFYLPTLTAVFGCWPVLSVRVGELPCFPGALPIPHCSATLSTYKVYIHFLHPFSYLCFIVWPTDNIFQASRAFFQFLKSSPFWINFIFKGPVNGYSLFLYF